VLVLGKDLRIASIFWAPTCQPLALTALGNPHQNTTFNEFHEKFHENTLETLYEHETRIIK
jgi:hypothetical protein